MLVFIMVYISFGNEFRLYKSGVVTVMFVLVKGFMNALTASTIWRRA